MKMRVRFKLCSIVLTTTLISNIVVAQETSAPAPAVMPVSVGAIDCVEVEKYKVSEDKQENQSDRAATIPARNIELILAGVLKHLPKKAKGVTAVDAEQGSCPNPETAAVLKGDILDFRKGNMALRYLVGFGAGAQKVRVKLTVLRKSGGEIIGQNEASDTKWGGAFGGTNTKGLDDFAEKSAQAAANIIARK
jgi:hypothetical protein